MSNDSQRPKVLVFDSGVGGLSILEEIHSAVPHCQLIFASDNAAYPYGTKSEHALIERVHQVVEQLLNHYQPDILVIACNSASTLALPHLRQHFNLPIVGVVPAIKPAAALSKSRVIGLLATPGTISRDYTRTLIDSFASDCQVRLQGSSEMVDMAEAKLRGEPVDIEALRRILAPLFGPVDDSSATAPHTQAGGAHKAIDTIVLACTHFPLLKAECEAAAPLAVQWVDSGAAIARRVAFLLKQLHFDAQPDDALAHPTADSVVNPIENPVANPAAAEDYENLAAFTRDDQALQQLSSTLQRFHIRRFDILR